MKISREVKTAILVISSILLFIWGYSFLKGRDLFNDYKTFYAVYDEVEGLAPSAPVTINGLAVGKVNSITLSDNGKLLVEIQVKTDFPISKSSIATIYEPSFIGGKNIAIIPNFKDPSEAEDGQTLSTNIKPGMLSSLGDKLSPLQTKVEKTVVSADSLLVSINNIFDKKTQENLQASIAELASTMKEFSQAAKGINSLIADNKTKIDGTFANLDHTSANFSKLSDSLAQANLGQAVKKLEKSLANVDNIINDVQAGKGSLGKLLKDEGMYKNLEGASLELKQLLADLKNNPKRYVHFSVFGKKATPYVEPKKVKDTIKN
ncbi:phospholipid/cholesterol/gamma-HCH transport system substrate-binding protein [Flavobacterium gossypii]|uniref:Phospholipid/cholesterol/gamma-HCH transport system substrate-binding protein n=2 Tax=Flavobacterium TaxID=237 RepID=A0A495M394_9FLAO|nr:MULTISPECIES: MlaD family protein [Flavobacterium]MBA9074952.1 phospholipid/cholesterol/gamma-HCH transport system substrate-binding protein [Flavobacterium gossypii]RKS20464.1 phospholipid/cholesterol/gamma-HCH transport system substrate-binding protein [Flavobacterium endophyticum]WDO12171.1 MlaD family protein [Flavobacterium sp. WW92]